MPLTAAFLPVTGCIFSSNRNSTFVKTFQTSPVNADRVQFRSRVCTRLRAQPTACATSDAGDDEQEERDPYVLNEEELTLAGEFPPEIPWLNKVVLTGRLGRDPELKQIRPDFNVCKFSMAVENTWDPDLGPDQERTSWYDVELWGSLGDRAASTAKKGLRVGISGAIGINSWTGADGETRTNIVVTADSFEILQSRSEPSPGLSNGAERGRRDTYQRNYNESQAEPDNKLNDLPF